MESEKENHQGVLTTHIFSEVTAAIIFFMILFIFAQQLQFFKVYEKIKVKHLQESVKNQIISSFKKHNLEDRIPTIFVDRGNPLVQKILLTHNVLRFASGEVNLKKEEDEEIIKLVGKVIKRNESFMEAIIVEGHADTVVLSKKIKRKYPTNWELSSGRATTIVRFLSDSLQLPKFKLSSVGLSSYHPINPDSLHLNRRIEFVIQYSYTKKYMYSKKAQDIYARKLDSGDLEDQKFVIRDVQKDVVIDTQSVARLKDTVSASGKKVISVAKPIVPEPIVKIASKKSSKSTLTKRKVSTLKKIGIQKKTKISTQKKAIRDEIEEFSFLEKGENTYIVTNNGKKISGILVKETSNAYIIRDVFGNNITMNKDVVETIEQ